MSSFCHHSMCLLIPLVVLDIVLCALYVPCCRLRCTGSAAMNLCIVARGSVDGYYQEGIHCWDYAAGDLIVREAGGVTKDTRGLWDSSCVYVGMVTNSKQNHVSRPGQT